MTQPKFAPIALDDEVRPTSKLDVPRPWTPHRPGEFTPGGALARLGGGTAGPDQGYATLLAQRFADRLVLTAGEHDDDVLAGVVAIALCRASLFGRAPVSSDVELALELFGYLGAAPDDLVAYRREHFSGVAHDDWRRRELAGVVPDASLRLNPRSVSSRGAEWRSLLKA